MKKVFNEVIDSESIKYKIIVPTIEDKEELKEAFKHFHDSRDIDTNYYAVNQLVHDYMDKSTSIIVDKELFESL